MQDYLFHHDIQLKKGDFAIGASHHQHTQHLLIASKGEYKASPEIGVGIDKILHTDNPTELLIEAKKNLTYDGMRINNISLQPNGKLYIDGAYE